MVLDARVDSAPKNGQVRERRGPIPWWAERRAGRGRCPLRGSFTQPAVKRVDRAHDAHRFAVFGGEPQDRFQRPWLGFAKIVVGFVQERIATESPEPGRSPLQRFQIVPLNRGRR
jgi:hypothetical protein